MSPVRETFGPAGRFVLRSRLGAPLKHWFEVYDLVEGTTAYSRDRATAFRFAAERLKLEGAEQDWVDRTASGENF